MNSFDLDNATFQRRMARATADDLAAFREWQGQPAAPCRVLPVVAAPSIWPAAVSILRAAAVSAVAGFALTYCATAALAADPIMQLVAIDAVGEGFILDSNMSPDDCAAAISEVTHFETADGRVWPTTGLHLVCELDSGN